MGGKFKCIKRVNVALCIFMYPHLQMDKFLFLSLEFMKSVETANVNTKRNGSNEINLLRN